MCSDLVLVAFVKKILEFREVLWKGFDEVLIRVQKGLERLDRGPVGGI